MDNFLTTTQAAAALGVNASRVRQLILNGQLPAEKHGRDWIIASADIETLLKSRQTSNTKE